MSTEKKEIELIKEQCEQHGLKIYQVFERAGVKTTTIENWKRKNPSQFEARKKIQAAIDEMIAEKQEA